MKEQIALAACFSDEEHLNSPLSNEQLELVEEVAFRRSCVLLVEVVAAHLAMQRVPAGTWNCC